jgi:hypothetical protein
MFTLASVVSMSQMVNSVLTYPEYI